MDLGRRVLVDSAVGIDSGEIIAIGATSELQASRSWDEIIEAPGCVLIPGLINSHTHGCMLYQRTIGFDQAFEDWFTTSQLPMMREMGLEDFADAERLTMIENVLDGNTTVMENCFFSSRARAAGDPEDATVRAAADIGVRLVLGTSYLSAHADPDFTEPIDDVLDRLDRALRKWHRRERLTVTPSLLLPWATEVDDLRRVLELTRNAGAMFHIHTAETPGYNLRCQDVHGARSNIDFLASAGALGPDVQLAGCSELDDDDVDLVARSGARVISMPTSDLFQSHAPLRIRELLGKGVRVSFGSNGCAGNGGQSMLAAAKDGAGLAKAVYRDPTVVDKDSALAMVTITAAQNLGIDDLVGSLEIGKRADIAVVDLTGPHHTPVLNVVAALTYSARSGDVRHVLVDGEVVVREGVCVRADPAPVIARVSEQAQRIARDSDVLRPRLTPRPAAW
jgi:5-methylthioadenosine/S-adenosylhomocysteine deaminase